MKIFQSVIIPTCLLVAVSCRTVLIADHGMSKMIVLTSHKPYCKVETDNGKIRTMLLNSDSRIVQKMSDDSIRKLEKMCNSTQELLAYQIGFIFPGTKWCGQGTIAKNYSDLGYYKKEDLCCREHDYCPFNLAHGECKQGICNSSPFTRSHCDCDATFRRCLQNVNTETANTIGSIFFNVLQVICFKEKSPCSQWQSDDSNQSDLRGKQCELKFTKSDRYVGSKITSFSWKQKPAKCFNYLLKKLGYL